ncbi:MAG TPA: hypothetical protein VLX59_03565 [Acidimicrobiales bacterium]|nr:hypothetical protein [Acidimicrobiales bacterium]
MDDGSGTPAAEVVHENTADETWDRRAFDLYQRGELHVQAFDTEGLVSAQVWGLCPRCGHELNIQQTLSTPIALREGRGLWAALTRRNLPVAPGIPDTVEVSCGCGHAHPGAPEDASGCGVSFRLPTAPPDSPRTP